MVPSRIRNMTTAEPRATRNPLSLSSVAESMRISPADRHARVPPSLSSVIRVALFVGWLAGTVLTFYALPHPLLHDEWENHDWRFVAAARALSLGPFLYFGPVVIAAIAAGFACYFGRNPEAFLHRADVLRRAKVPLLVLLSVAHATIIGVGILFVRVVASG